ncbi:protein artichoke-like [Diorhabda carinulata]|uniref:protein artichoke-like n=1 Tax=Diorhabda carinulata TaxID=1163345 RepID=UPI0025A2EB07|nr:protein artichoke-like [Diorhabda carinulata]
MFINSTLGYILKMMFVSERTLLIVILLLYRIVNSSQSRCKYENEQFSCENIILQDFYKELFSEEWNFMLTTVSSIEISNSNLTIIEYLYKTSRLGNIENLAIKNSSVGIIYNSSFNDFEHLKILDLGFNKLRSVSFSESLPNTISHLLLNNNNITNVSLNFLRLPLLKYLDLSYNKIKNIEFGQINQLYDINLSNNEIISLESFQLIQHLVRLNLGSNRIDTFEENRMPIGIESLDLSYNNLSSISLLYGKKYLNLAGCKLDTFHAKIPISYLNLKRNKFHNLSNLTLSLKKNFNFNFVLSLDVSNSSIYEITENYFNDMQFEVLNLSLNRIEVIRENTFTNCGIFLLDLSESKIGLLQKYSFNNVFMNTLYMMRNNISTLDNFSYETEVFTINLSFNPIKFIKNNYFKNCKNLMRLILSQCHVHNIEPNSFTTTLKFLDLTFNKLNVLDENIFGWNIDEINLKGNAISRIKKGSFSNLYSLNRLNLSNLGIKYIESFAFTNLSKIREIYLDNNEINRINANLFTNTDKLIKIDFSDNPINEVKQFSNKLKLLDVTLTFNGDFESESISNFNIKKLIIKNSNITTLKTDSFRGLFGLSELYFNNSSIFSVETGALNDLINLIHLDAHNLFKNIKFIDKNILNDLKSLTKLNLSNTNLDYLHSYCFQGLNKLELLNLSRNRISVLKSDTFFGLIALRHLDLTKNQLSTLVSGVFNSLINLKKLYMENNNLKLLETNIFTSLRDLEILDVSKNKLKILQNGCFQGLDRLSELNLANNNIEHVDISLFKPLKYLKILNMNNNNLGLNGSSHNSLAINTLSSLIDLEILDLTYNFLSNLNTKFVFMSLRKLTHLYLDHNYLKFLDFDSLLKNSKRLVYVGVSYNLWNCTILANVVEILYSHNVNYYPNEPVFDADNIEGINCVDICRYLYCDTEFN